MASRAFLVALVAAAFVATAAAQMQLCVPGGVPGSPRNIRAAPRYDTGKRNGVITVNWENPTGDNPKLGCPTDYVVQACDVKTNRCTVVKQALQGSVIQTAQKAEVVVAPGVYTVKVQAVNSKANKLSPEITGPQVTVPAPAPVGPCLSSGTPLSPTNLKVTKNAWNNAQKKAEIIVTWQNNIGPNAGCPTAFSVFHGPKGGVTSNAPLEVKNPVQSQFSQTFFVGAGSEIEVTVQAFNKPSGKRSGAATIRVIPARAGIAPL